MIIGGRIKISTNSFQNQNDVFTSLLLLPCNGWNDRDFRTILRLASWDFSIGTAASASNYFFLWDFSDGFSESGEDLLDCAVAKSHNLGGLHRKSAYLFHVEVLFCNEVDESLLLLFGKPFASRCSFRSWRRFSFDTGEAPTLPKLCLNLRGHNVWSRFHCYGSYL